MTNTESKSFIVTGGCGFVGSNLTAALTERFPGSAIVVIDDFRSGSFANLIEAFSRRSLPPYSGEVLGKPLADIDWRDLLSSRAVAAVFHEAAITDTTVNDESEMLRVNAEQSRHLMAACIERRVPLVYASSAATYGTPPEARDRRPFALAAAGQPNNVYGFSKWMMECHHRRLARESGGAPRLVGLRYFNVFGPGESRKGKMASMIYQLARQLLAGERPRLFADGSQARDQVYVDDVVDCTIAAAGLTAGANVVPGVYNVGSGSATSFNEIAASLRRGLAIGEHDLPTEFFEMPGSVRAFYQDYTCADVSETARGLGWRPRWKPSDAVAHYAAIMKTEHRPPTG